MVFLFLLKSISTMKKIIYLSALLAFQFGFTQETVTFVVNKTEKDTLIYDSKAIEVKPEYPGGLKEFYSFIGKNFMVPNVKNLQGKIIVSFVVEKDGSLGSIKVLKDIGYGTEAEAIRVLNLSEKWTPAFQNGQTVRCFFVLPISIETK